MKRSVIINRLIQLFHEASLETDESLANRVLDICLQSGMQLPTQEIPDPEFPELPRFRWSKEDEE
jgi:hypothetical protein